MNRIQAVRAHAWLLGSIGSQRAGECGKRQVASDKWQRLWCMINRILSIADGIWPLCPVSSIVRVFYGETALLLRDMTPSRRRKMAYANKTAGSQSVEKVGPFLRHWNVCRVLRNRIIRSFSRWTHSTYLDVVHFSLNLNVQRQILLQKH